MNGYEPLKRMADGMPWWTWWVRWTVTPPHLPEDLPAELFRLLPCGMDWGDSKWYPTRQAALQALAVAMGRAETK